MNQSDQWVDKPSNSEMVVVYRQQRFWAKIGVSPVKSKKNIQKIPDFEQLMLDIPDGVGKSDSVGLLYRLTTRREVVRELLFFPGEVFSHKKPKRLTAKNAEFADN